MIQTRVKCHLALLGLAGTLLSQCMPNYERLDLTSQTNGPYPASETVSDELIRLPVGSGVVVIAKAISSNRKAYDEDIDLQLAAEDESVLIVRPTEGEFRYTFLAARLGRTCLEVKIDGYEEDCIPVEVVAQPATPMP